MFGKRKWSPWWSLATLWILLLWHIARSTSETGEFAEKFLALFPLMMLATAIVSVVAFRPSKRPVRAGN